MTKEKLACNSKSLCLTMTKVGTLIWRQFSLNIVQFATKINEITISKFGFRNGIGNQAFVINDFESGANFNYRNQDFCIEISFIFGSNRKICDEIFLYMSFLPYVALLQFINLLINYFCQFSLTGQLIGYSLLILCILCSSMNNIYIEYILKCNSVDQHRNE